MVALSGLTRVGWARTRAATRRWQMPQDGAHGAWRSARPKRGRVSNCECECESTFEEDQKTGRRRGEAGGRAKGRQDEHLSADSRLPRPSKRARRPPNLWSSRPSITRPTLSLPCIRTVAVCRTPRLGCAAHGMLPIREPAGNWETAVVLVTLMLAKHGRAACCFQPRAWPRR